MTWLSSRGIDILFSGYQIITLRSKPDDLEDFGQFPLVDTSMNAHKIAFFLSVLYLQLVVHS